MSDLKMSDILNLPAKQNETRHFGNTVYTVPDDKVILSADSCEIARYIVEAINNHDRLVDENKELRSFLESLQLDVSNEIKLEQLLNKQAGDL